MPRDGVAGCRGGQDPCADRALPAGAGGGRIDLGDDEVDHAVEQLIPAGYVLVEGHRDDGQLFGQLAHAQGFDACCVGQGYGAVQRRLQALGETLVGVREQAILAGVFAYVLGALLSTTARSTASAYNRGG
jgi:hypothetical protein